MPDEEKGWHNEAPESTPHLADEQGLACERWDPNATLIILDSGEENK